MAAERPRGRDRHDPHHPARRVRAPDHHRGSARSRRCRGSYRAGGGEFWVARVKATDVVGTDRGDRHRREHRGDPQDVPSRSDQRGSGLAGRSSWSTLVSRGREHGYRTLLLGTTERMAGAHRFYAKHEFEEIPGSRLPAEFPRMGVDTGSSKRTLPGNRLDSAVQPAVAGRVRIQSVNASEQRSPTSTIAVHHTGSTRCRVSSAKPIIDVTMTVPDTDDEDVYVPALEAAGYVYVLREADWFGHRLMVREFPCVNLHIFPAGVFRGRHDAAVPRLAAQQPTTTERSTRASSVTLPAASGPRAGLRRRQDRRRRRDHGPGDRQGRVTE